MAGDDSQRTSGMMGMVPCGGHTNHGVNEVKAKINALRSRFTTELLKIREKPSESGTDDVYKTSFDFFEKMLFLADHVQARKGTCNISVLKPTIQSQEIEEEICSSHSPLPIDTDYWAENMDAAATDHSHLPKPVTSGGLKYLLEV
ncbi:hypothetical protein CBL_13489 [Carabus blaptoides fortunei]